MSRTVSLAGTSLGNQLTQQYDSKIPTTGIIGTTGTTGLTGTTGTAETGYIFKCPRAQVDENCQFLHQLKRHPGSNAHVNVVMDHIRLDRKNRHLNGSLLSSSEQTAVNTQYDPYALNWVRSGDQKSFFLPGKVFNDWGFALIYFPQAEWDGEVGAWDILELHPTNIPVPKGQSTPDI